MSAHNADLPRRGVAPYQPAVFFSSARIKTEAAILGGLLYVFEVIRGAPLKNPDQDFPGLVRGMRLCDAYGYFQSAVPESRLSIEHAMLLGLELVKGEELRLGHCTNCGALILVDQLAVTEALCITCAGDHTPQKSKSQEPNTPARGCSSVEATAQDNPVQGSLF